MTKDSFIDSALEEGICSKCDAQVMAGHSGGFMVKLDRVLLSKFQELELQMSGGKTYRLESVSKGTFAKYRSLMELRSSINGTQPLVVAAHVCKEGELKDATIPF